jgi:hypothetical protein
MTRQASNVSRRTFLGAVAGQSMLARQVGPKTPLEYSLAIRPRHAVLGEPVALALTCVALEATEAVTFDDRSLTLKMARRNSLREPDLSFPNRFVAQDGNKLVRYSREDRHRLFRGEQAERTVDMFAVFPAALDLGDFEISYEIGSDERSWRAGPRRLTIESGPAAMSALFALLADEDVSQRERAAALLHRMTARVVGFSAKADREDRQSGIENWRAWLENSGSKLPWNFHSTGATFGELPLPAPSGRRSKDLGGIAYRRRALGPLDGKAVSSALAEWLRKPAAGPVALRGSERIADQTVHYPSDDTMIEPDGEIVPVLGAAISRLAEAATSAAPDSSAAMLILATVAKMPDGRFVPPLEALEAAASKVPSWRRVSFVAGGLLDVLDPSRAPVGGG